MSGLVRQAPRLRKMAGIGDRASAVIGVEVPCCERPADFFVAADLDRHVDARILLMRPVVT